MQNREKNKTKKILKFVNLLIICAVVKSSCSFVFAMQPQKGIELKEASIEEIRKKAKGFIEDFKKNSEISEKEDEKLYKQNLEKFKNFKEQDYEVKGFNLKVYFKRGVPILVYEDEIIKAKIVFIPIDNVNESLLLTNEKDVSYLTPTDKYFFKATEQNNKGLIHIAEHCLYSTDVKIKLRKKFKNSALNAHTFPLGFQIDYNSTFSGEELEKEIFKILLKPGVLENEKLFEIEKRRAIIEMTNNQNEFEKDEFSLNSVKEAFMSGGIPEQMKNVTLNEIKNVYEKYFHPSNLLITKYIKLNSTKIKSFLKNLKINYLNYFKNYKETNFNRNYFIKQKPFEKISVSYAPNIFVNVTSKEKYEKNKYLATINLYDNYSLQDGKNPKILEFLNEYGISYYLACDYKENGKITEIEDFVKKLGYTSCFFKDFSSCLKLYGNNPELFTEKILKENSKKIFNFIYSKLLNFNLEEIKLNSYSFYPYNYSNENSPENKEKFGLKSDILRYENEILDSKLQKSFYFTSNPISNKLFKLTKENEIKQTTPNEVKNTIPKLKELIDYAKNPIIKVYEHVKINKPDKKHEEIYENSVIKTLYPIKIANYSNYNLGMLATLFLIEKLDLENLVFKDAINYYRSINTSFFKDYVSTAKTPTKKISQDVVNYIFKIFNSFKENLNPTEKEFENLKNAIKEHVKNMLATFEDGKKTIDAFLKAINQYLEKGLDEKANVFNKNKGFEITNRTTRSYIFIYYTMLIDENIYFESFEDRKNYFKNKKEFFKKYGQFFLSEHTASLIDKEFIKDLNELLIKPNLKRIEFRNNCLKEFIKNYDEIKFEDFKKAVKSAELVERTKYEQDQKQEDENSKIDVFYKIK